MELGIGKVPPTNRSSGCRPSNDSIGSFAALQNWQPKSPYSISVSFGSDAPIT